MQRVLLLETAPHDHFACALAERGYEVLAVLRNTHGLLAQVERLAPDIVVLATDVPDDPTFVSLDVLASCCPRPVVIFAKEGTRELIRRAVDCGVAAYVVDGWAPERITPIIEAATARFEAYESMKRELASTQAKLTERKLVEKAKGIVMQQRKMSEQEAYTALRKMAMDQNLALAEVSRRVIAVAKLLA